jgi:Methyltransferase domain
MEWSRANEIVEEMRRDFRLFLPPLAKSRGFCSSRVEHLLNRLVSALPEGECYLEVGSLEGRTLQAASHGNEKLCIGVDPGRKYASSPEILRKGVELVSKFDLEVELEDVPKPIGVLFYDGDHSEKGTFTGIAHLLGFAARESVVVVDDWDRQSVRDGVFQLMHHDERVRMLREMPEYTQGPDFAPPNHCGYYYGVAILGFRR